jgi:hypothetical protein
MTEPRFDYDDYDEVMSTYRKPQEPRKSWWKSMPWIVRAAIWVTALLTLVPLLALIGVGGLIALASFK